MVNVIIIGAGGHGHELYSYIRDLESGGQEIRLVGFVDESKPSGKWEGIETIGDFSALKDFLWANQQTIYHYITAVGDNQVRRMFTQRTESLQMQNLKVLTLCHPSAMVGHNVEIKEGTCLAPASIITTDVRIGKHCILNVKVSVSHDCVVGDYVNINPGAIICGNVTLGQGCYIGAGATVIDKVSIGDWTIIGAQAVVTEDIPANVTAVGVPARIIKKHQ